MFYLNIPAGTDLKSIPWTLAEFRHNGIVQLPHENNNYNVCQKHKEKWGLVKTTIYVPSGRNHAHILLKLHNQTQGVKKT